MTRQLINLWEGDAGNSSAADPTERQSSRPDLGVLCYPVITTAEHAHPCLRQCLLGGDATAERLREVSSELHVSPQTPPCFIWHTVEDPSVPVENSALFAAALRKHGVPFDPHVYEKGHHGLGLADKPPFARVHPWANDLILWFKGRGFAQAAPGAACRGGFIRRADAAAENGG